MTVYHFAVLDPTRTGQGLGTQFVEALSEELRERGFTEILFEEPNANETYLAFFRKIGARFIDQGAYQKGWLLAL